VVLAAGVALPGDTPEDMLKGQIVLGLKSMLAVVLLTGTLQLKAQGLAVAKDFYF
jgi:hypothetical protein